MILLTFGTRPEFIKIKPLIEVFTQEKYPHKVLFTGQHTNLLPEGVASLVDYSLQMQTGENRLDAIVSSLMNQSSIWEDPVEYVLVQGDTTSAFAMALAAFHRKIKVLHLEAGLRTYDLNHPYPEEFNRQAISRLAHAHFCPTEVSAANLKNEMIDPKKIFITGNTVLDNLVTTPTLTGKKVIITMHRRENHELIPEWFKEMDNIAARHPDLEFVFPIHPNPNVKKHKDIFKHVKVIDPLEYNKFIEELSQCRLLISDSGGIQEEASFFKKRVIVCRKKTERVEGLGVFFELCHDPGDLSGLFEHALEQPPIPSETPSPFGDGTAAIKIYNIIKEL